jgi:DNA-binding CsgD family transcriptional regulator
MSRQSPTMLDLIAYLAERPTMDQLAQYLVLQTFREHNPRGALIYVFFTDGTVQSAGSFGLPTDVVRALQSLSLWDHAPAVDAIRDGSPVILNGSDAIRTNYPWLEQQPAMLTPTVAWPLGVGHKRNGSLQVHFAEPFDEGNLSDAFTEISPILGLYLGIRDAVAESTREALETSRRHSNGRIPLRPEALTTRQQQILELLAAGMTNPQIASRIGFSDSTVRQETMAIYRFLGADGRRDAVHIATMRGLLDTANVS